MQREKYELALGTTLLVVGLVILLFVFVNVYGIVSNPGDFLKKQMPEEKNPPVSSFDWKASNMTVTLTDTSRQGSSSIVSYGWEFGDGNTEQSRNPTHTFMQGGDYSIKLTVTDQNGLSSTSRASVNIQMNSTKSGGSDPDSGGMNFDITSAIMPFGIAIIIFGMYLVMFLVGAAILKAGWNLIKPKPESITVRVKPKHLQLENVEEGRRMLQSPPTPSPPPVSGQALPSQTPTSTPTASQPTHSPAGLQGAKPQPPSPPGSPQPATSENQY